jgi:hypothetical protein
MIDLDFEFEAPMWEWTGKGSWHFITLPQEISADIKAFTKHLARGFRTVRVSVRIGETTWQTSLFPSNEHKAYLLPVKAAVRTSENLSLGPMIAVSLSVPT